MPIPKPFVFLAFAVTCVLEAANPPKSFVMKTTEPVIVSNTLLAPGNHLWRLLDSQSNRHIVQISDQTTQRVEAVILAIPRYRELISAENEVDFWETPVGYAKAVRTWFLPGDNSGQEFPYSKKVVFSLGQLLTPPMADPNQVEPAAPPPPRSFPVKPQEAEDKVSTQWPEGSWAVITDGPPASPKPATHRDGIWDTLKHLPLTATIAPLIGLIGAALLLVFFLSGRRKNRQMPASR
jgi:hypothetical protein